MARLATIKTLPGFHFSFQPSLAVRQLERGEVSALELIDTLLAEGLTVRENRRINDRERVLALAELQFVDRREVVHFLGPPVVATALLDRLLHHAVVIQIEGSSYRLRQHADLMPEHLRSKALITPSILPAVLRRRGRPPKLPIADQPAG